jgi:RimJ/RimL family protein N-acetyltransferase
MLAPQEVSQFIVPPPTTKQGFDEFISWTHRTRAAGRYICFGIVPAGYDSAVGVFQIQLRKDRTPEWGFAIGSPFWGTGLFLEGAEAVLDFGFRGLGLEDIGARSVTDNARGNAGLRKAGALCERIIHDGFVRNGRQLDQYYWTVYANSRPRPKIVWDAPVH